jgi:hypothetical protein
MYRKKLQSSSIRIPPATRFLRPAKGRILVPAIALLMLALGISGYFIFKTPRTPDEALKREFEAIADQLYGGKPGTLYSRTAIDQYQESLDRAGHNFDTQATISANLAIEFLRIGEFDKAVTTIDQAMEKAESASPPVISALRRTRATIYLRKAEISNCVERHNRSCCIFPLTNGGVHTVAEPIKQSFTDYLQCLKENPAALDVRWLVNVTAMAAGEYPDSVPVEFRIPPNVFESEADIGRFHDVAPELGLADLNLAGGSIFEDFDNDGWLDIVSSSCDPAGPLVFKRNNADGTWSDLSESSGLSLQKGGLNCIGGDYDNDGDVDVLVLRGAWMLMEGRIRNSLLRNNGDNTFTDVTHEANLAEPAMPTQAAAWFDFDGDDWLDLFIGNESLRELEPEKGGEFPCQLFRNNGNGTFTDMATSAGVTNDRYTKGVTAGDYDNDGDMDLYCSNVGKNRLYRNNGDGTFTDVAEAAGVTQPEGRSFVPWFFDYDNDGWLDLFVGNYESKLPDFAAHALGADGEIHRPALYHNNGDGTFSDYAITMGLNRPFLPMGANFGDFDNDGWLDIYLGTGDPNYETLTPNVALRNKEGWRFQDITMSAGLGHLQKGHGVAFGDWDHDGDQDIFHQLGGFFEGDRFQNVLFENPGHSHAFLVLKLIGVTTNKSAYGARIRVDVTTPEGNRSIHRAVGSVSSFGGSPQRQEIGLGNATAIEKVEITWPAGGIKHELMDLSLNATYRIIEGSALAERLPNEPIKRPDSQTR